MGTMHWTRPAIGFSAVFATLTAIACSSSKSSIDEGNSPAGDYTYCGALTASCNPFYAGTSTACSTAARDQCSTFQPTHSQTFQDAVVSCAKKFSPCIADFYDCIDAEATRATPTAAQTKVKNDFCSLCPDAAGSGTLDACSTFFRQDADASSGIYGVGVPLLKVNDTIAAEIGSKCIGSSGGRDGGSDAGASDACDPLTFLACENTVVQARTTPSACQGDGG
jgi:hypothetical protein